MQESDSRLRVGVFAALDPTAAGGVQTNLVSMVRGMTRTHEQIRLNVLTPTTLAEKWRTIVHPSFSVSNFDHSFPWYRGHNETLKQRLLTWARRQVDRRSKTWNAELQGLGLELIHFPYQVAFDVALPSIYEPWDLQHFHLPQFFSARERAWRDALYKRASQRATLVVTATRATKEDLVAAYGIPRERIAVVYREPGLVQTAPSSAQRQKTLANFQIQEPFAFYPAASYPHKNHLNLIKALANLAEKTGKSPLLVLSGRPDKTHDEAIEGEINALGQELRVKRLGVLTDDELAVLYSEARLLVFPSRFEGLGLPLLEAMQYKLPIVAANASCIPEVVADAAVLFDPDDPNSIADALDYAWHDDALRASLAQRGSRRLQCFSWDRAAPLFNAIYRKVAGRTLDPEERGLVEGATA